MPSVVLWSFGDAAVGALRLDFLELGEAGDTVHELGSVLALDDGGDVVQESLGDHVALGVDVLGGQFLLGVGALGERELLDGGLILLARLADDAHHDVGLAGDGGLDGGAALGISLFHVHLGRDVRGASLHERELDRAVLGVYLAAQVGHEVGGGTAQLHVTERVFLRVRGGVLGDELAVLIVDAFADGDYALALFLEDLLDVGGELGEVEVHFGDVDEVGTVACVGGYCRGGGQPARVTAHYLDDGDHALIEHARVQVDLHAGGRDVLGGGSVAGAVVDAVKVVVYGLGYAHDVALVTVRVHELADLVAGVHGVVTAVIEEVLDVVLLEHFQDAEVVGLVVLVVLQLVAAGTESGRGRAQKTMYLRGVFLAHVVKLVVQYADDAVRRAQDLSDLTVLECFFENAARARVDDGSGTAGLSEQQCAFEVFHVVSTPCRIFFS